MKITLSTALTVLSLFIVHFSSAQTVITSCSTDFTDMQGPGGYLSNENAEWLICPDTLTEYLTIEFSHVDIEVSEGPGLDSTGCNDVLYIHDGMDDLAPLVGSFCGEQGANANQPMIVGNELKVGDQFKPTNSSGCFFIRFVSDAKDNRSGWTASVSCCTPSLSNGATDGIDTPIATNAGADINFEIDNNCVRTGRLEDFTDFVAAGSACFSAGLTEPHQSFYAFESNDLGGFSELIVSPTDSVGNIQMLVYGPVFIDSTGTHYDGGVINWCVTGAEPEPLFFNAGPSQTFILAVATELPGRIDIITSSQSVALPIEMVDYSLTKQGRNVSINWTTSLELNNAGFEVYRSTNGKEYEMIGFEKSKGNTNMRQDYRFIDQPNATGQVYYYISQIDYSGSKVDYDVLTAKFAQANIKAYPNPSSGAVTISTGSDGSLDTKIQVYDQVGRLVQDLTTRESTLQIDLSVGIYSILVSNASQTQTIKQIITDN